MIGDTTVRYLSSTIRDGNIGRSALPRRADLEPNEVAAFLRAVESRWDRVALTTALC
jgi:hypothetical protein